MIEKKFKETEVGKIPEDWEVISLGEIGEVKMCKRIMKYQTSEHGDIPFYKIGTFGKTPDAYISKTLYELYKKNYSYPQKGDILLSAAGTIGRTVVFNGEPSYFQDSNIVWIDNNESIVSNGFLYYIYKTLSWVTESGTIPRIYNGIVRAIKFPIPLSKDEQEYIKNALSNIDALIFQLEKLIEKKRAIKQGAMQELLTGKKRLKGFSEPWANKKISDIGRFYSGLSGKSKTDFGVGAAYYITFLNVLNNPIIDTSILESVNVNKGENQNEVKQGDLFFNTSSETPEEVGICSWLDEQLDKTYLNSFCFGFRIADKQVYGLYLAYYFRSKQGRDLMTMLAQGATRYNLSKENFGKSYIKIPSEIEEQIAISKFINNMDSEISSLESKRSKYIAIKQGMMQQLLTGKIRLI